MKIHLASFLMISFMLLLYSCDQGEPKEPIDPRIDKSHDANIFGQKGFPLSKRSTIGLRENFKNCYIGDKCGTVNHQKPYGLNKQFHDRVWHVNWEVFKNSIDILHENIGDTGLVFHYSIKEDNNDCYFGYVLSKGILNNSKEIELIPFDNGDYIELTLDNQNGFRFISIPEANALVCKYNDIRVFDNYACPTGYYKASEDKENSIIRQCFYFGQHLMAFEDHNFKQTPKVCDTEDPQLLEISSGAIHVTHSIGGVNRSYLAQTPILKWHHPTKDCAIDDVFEQGYFFRKKALDVGHLCPPNCSDPTDPFPICL